MAKPNPNCPRCSGRGTVLRTHSACNGKGCDACRYSGSLSILCGCSAGKGK